MNGAFIIFIHASLFGFSCNDNRTFHERLWPPRADGVPENTFWRGGIDGGNWFEIVEISKEARTATIKIYKSRTGELMANRVFKFICNSIIHWDILADQIQMFDGKKILLRIQPFERNRYCYLE